MADTENVEETAPAGAGNWTVSPGESIDSIAEDTGHFWQTLWDLPENAELKAARPSRTVLLPGDKVTVPDIRTKTESRPVDEIHRFKRKGVPAEIRFQVLDKDGEAIAERPYVLRVGKRRYEGETDTEGKLFHYVSPAARVAELFVKTDPTDDTVTKSWTLKIGYLWPVETIQGMQSRLNNLGYRCGAVDGDIGPRASAALRRFLADNGLQEDSDYDAAVQDVLRTLHGS